MAVAAIGGFVALHRQKIAEIGLFVANDAKISSFVALIRRIVAIVSLFAAIPAAADTTSHREPLLALVRAVEAPRGYNDYERRNPLPPPQPVSRMTVGEVLDWQSRSRRAGAPSTAAGAYQIIRTTLARLVRQHGISREVPFDSALQDRLAHHLLDECGPLGPVETHAEYGNCLAGIWAGLPMTAGTRRGRSAYHGLAGNRALTSPESVLATLAGRKVAFTPTASAPPAVTDSEVLAFGAIRLRRTKINAAMRDARAAGTLAPSVRQWSFDPYAVR